MAINEKKMQIVIDNYFKSECNVDTSIRDAFEKGFRIGVKKTVYRPKGEWVEERVKSVGDVWEKTWYRCSKCKRHEYRKTNFCPNCGADMRGEK